jgi:hypothetical protein
MAFRLELQKQAGIRLFIFLGKGAQVEDHISGSENSSDRLGVGAVR